MDKVEMATNNITDLMKDFVELVKRVWKYLEKFFLDGATQPFVN